MCTCFVTRYRFLLQGQLPLIVRDSREPPSRCLIIISIHIFLSIPWQCLFQSKIDALFYSYVLHEIISYPESKIDVDMWRGQVRLTGAPRPELWADNEELR